MQYIALACLLLAMPKGKTVTIRVSESTFEEIKEVCADLGDSYNFNQFVNQSLGAILEVIGHEGEKIPIPRFAMMARLMREYESKHFSEAVREKGS